MSNNENSFKTQVKLDILLDRTDNYEIETLTMNLRWNLELECKNYGVRSIIITVPEQQCGLSVRVWGDDDDTYEDVTLDVKDVEIDRGSSDFTGLIPQSLVYFKGKWRLEF
jgi:hypothetical protein